MVSSRSNWIRLLGGYACLAAVLLVYAPHAMLAWWAGTGACCKSDYCPIPEHHRQSKSPASAEHHGMDCEHSAPGIAGCTMSCCHDTQQALMAPVVFMLERSIEHDGLSSVAQISEPATVQRIFQSSKPLSPPPRFVVAAS